MWIVDLRTSAGLPTAIQPWSFEDVAINDIPCAVKHILKVTGREGPDGNLDVVAHCMGAAMLSMALLADPLTSSQSSANGEDLFLLNPKRIRKLVLSQVGPAVVMSPANLLRAYLMRYLQYYLPLGEYSFRPPTEHGSGGQLFDRFLATLPYPTEEFKLENPFWPPGALRSWVGTRHRMDALYGSDFKLANMPDSVLDHIDDFFGPLSLETVTQVIHFARFRRIIDRTGFNRYTDANRIEERFTFPVLSIHGQDNGLADRSTLDAMTLLLGDGRMGLGGEFTPKEIKNYGHQDCLLGKDAKKDVFAHIGTFLMKDPSP